MRKSKSTVLIEEFSDAAKHWGWQEDQGCDQSEIANSEKQFRETKAALEAHIAKLEKTISKLKAGKERTKK